MVYYLVVSTDAKFVVSSEGYKRMVEIMGEKERNKKLCDLLRE
jgi:hypothetical protein